MPFKFNPFTDKLDEVNESGTGDVTGPGSSTPGDIAVFANNMGNSIADSGKKISDLLQAAFNLSDLTDFSAARSNLGLTNAAIATTTQFAVLVGDVNNGIANVGPGTTNTVLLGNTGSNPSFGTVPSGALPGSGSITLVAGSNITLTPSSGVVSLGGSITIASSGVSFPLLAPNGSSTDPSYSFSGQTNAGIYLDGTNTAVSWNGSRSWLFGFTNQSINVFEPLSGMTFSYLDPGASPATSVGNNIYYSINCSTGPYTFNLPNSSRTGQIYVVKDRTGNAATNNITVSTPGGTVTIDGSTTYVINRNFAAVGFIFNGVSYEVW